MNYNQVKRLFTYGERNLLEEMITNDTEVCIINDLNSFKEQVVDIKDIFISKTEKIQLFRESNRIFGNVHVGFINRFEIEDGHFQFNSTGTEVYRNDRKAVLVRTKNIINGKSSVNNVLYFYNPAS